VKRFRGGLVFKAHRLLYHSTPDLRVIKKKKVGAKPAEGRRGVVAPPNAPGKKRGETRPKPFKQVHNFLQEPRNLPR